MFTIPNVEVRWKFLFEPALTEIYSELRRHYSKPLIVDEGTSEPSVAEWNQSALNLIVGKFSLVAC